MAKLAQAAKLPVVLDSGCNGIIYLLLQRVNGSDENSLLALLENVHSTRQEAHLAHVLEPVGSVASLLPSQMSEAMRRQSESGTGNTVMRLDDDVQVFFETLAPPIRLLIFGAGDDVVPLTEMARNLGWQIFVFDGRAHYARPERFPNAHQVSVRDSASDLKDLQLDPRTVAIVMTHSYSQDSNFLQALVSEPVAYIGLLGPRNRNMRLLADAHLLESDVEHLHGPAGLDIGADGPEQVALSIIAEIQACLNGRDGGPLRRRAGSIHSRASDGVVDQPFVPGIVCA